MKLSLDLYKYIFYLQIMFSISLIEKIWQEQVQVLEVFPPQAVCSDFPPSKYVLFANQAAL